jgi:predicted DCC family thiol-disulfide oxidoreductase YuxK
MNRLPAGKQVQVFFDGDCPLCTKEINMLRKLDRNDKIVFTDIAAEDFDTSQYDKSWRELMERIHGREADGTWIEGVEVFRQLYSAVGFGWLMAITRVPGIKQLLDWMYVKFAKNRLSLTGRKLGSENFSCRLDDAETSKASS